MSASLLPLVALALGAAVAASDLYARRVPNRWLGIALGVGATWMLWAWLRGVAEFPLPALLGLLAGLAALMPFHLMRWMGAGDVKYFATIGFLLGWKALLPIWIIASLLAGVHALTVLFGASVQSQVPALQVASRQLSVRLEGQAWWQRMRAARAGRQGIPYAAYLAFGSIAWMFASAAGVSP